MLLTISGGMVCCNIFAVLIDIRGNFKPFALFQSYLSNGYLYVVANAKNLLDI